MSEYLVSATAVGMFEDCPRKWGWRYLEGLKVQNPSAKKGDVVHTLLEAWLKKRVMPPLDEHGKLARALIPLLPPPQAVEFKHVEVEMLMSLGGVKFIGKIDLYDQLQKPPTIYDHKTTSDLVWALTPERMPSDIQASLYAAWGLTYSKAEEVRLCWNYVRTKGAAKTLPVSRLVRGQDIKERVSKTIETAQEILLVEQSGCGALDVPYDASACEAYGGCPYKTNCNLSAKERMVSIMGQGTKASFMERLKAKKNGTPVAAPKKSAKAPAVNPPEAEEEEAPRKMSALERVKAKKAEKLKPDPVVEVEETPEEEEQLASGEEENPRKGRGRPAGSPNRPVVPVLTLNEVWSRFVVATMDPDAADELLAAYVERFGG